MTDYKINFDDEVIVKHSAIKHAAEEVIKTLKKELPEEAQCVTVVKEVLSIVEKKINARKLYL